jgi:hypothetical protein
MPDDRQPFDDPFDDRADGPRSTTLTLSLDTALLRAARAACGAGTDDAVVVQALRALVRAALDDDPDPPSSVRLEVRGEGGIDVEAIARERARRAAHEELRALLGTERGPVVDGPRRRSRDRSGSR